MERPVIGDVVILPFPYADLTEMKKRPALVVAELENYDVILCQITSKFIPDKYSVLLKPEDFSEGHLRQESCIRPNRLFTADSRIILYKAGSLTKSKIIEVIEKILEIFVP